MSTFNQLLLPGTINLFVNSRCNYRCKHCYATFADIPGAELPELSADHAVEILSQIASEPLADGMLARKITFVGGEPTLHPSLPSLIKYAKAFTIFIVSRLTVMIHPITSNYRQIFVKSSVMHSSPGSSITFIKTLPKQHPERGTGLKSPPEHGKGHLGGCFGERVKKVRSSRHNYGLFTGLSTDLLGGE